MRWVIVYYSEGVQREVMSFPAGIAARYLHLTQRIITFGPNLGMPHSRAMGHGLFELRMKSTEGIGRAFYGNLAGQRVMILHAFVKKSAKTPDSELKIARDRLKEVQKNADA